jgi:hypothetical protein
MARASARSFNQYSGIDRFKQQQWHTASDGKAYRIPSAFDRLQDPRTWGAGTLGRQSLESPAFSWSLGLSERPAAAVGRSSRDPFRVGEQVMRGVKNRDQFRTALELDAMTPPPDQFQQIMADQVQQDMGDTKNYGNAQGQGPLRNYMGRSPSSWGRNTVTNSMFPRRPSYSF